MPPTKVTRSRKKVVKLVVTVFLLIITVLTAQAGNNKTPFATDTSLRPGLYQVTQVHDGDTISVNMNGIEEKVRFIGVDTPETQDPRKPVECFGKAAAGFTKQLLSGSRVRLEADALSSNRDRYNRLLRYVYLADGRLINAEIIKSGYGFAYTSFPFTKSDDFKSFEHRAENEKRGLWSSCQPSLDSNGYIHSNPQE